MKPKERFVLERMAAEPEKMWLQTELPNGHRLCGGGHFASSPTLRDLIKSGMVENPPGYYNKFFITQAGINALKGE